MEQPRFCCDAMLGGLARWLRFAGYDVTFPCELATEEILAQAREEKRWFVTRNGRLAARAGPRVLCLRATAVPEQLVEVRRRLHLERTPAPLFSRCSRCNGLLEPLHRAAAAALVPPFVAAHAASFSRCPQCGQVYWPGSHSQRILAQLQACGLAGGEEGGET